MASIEQAGDVTAFGLIQSFTLCMSEWYRRKWNSVSDHSKPTRLGVVLSTRNLDELLLPYGGLHHLEEGVNYNPKKE